MFRLSRGAPSTGTLSNSRGRNNKRVKKESKEATTYQRFDFLKEASAEEYEEKLTKYRDDFDIIYAATPNFDDKDQAILPFLSKELRFELLSIKLGLIFAGSYGTNNALRRHDIRLSHLDVGSVVRRSMHIHLVPKGCGAIIEAVLKYFIGEELGHCIRGEHMSISNEMRGLTSGLFGKEVFMGISYANLKNQSIARGNVIDLFRQIQLESSQQVTAMTNASETWKAEMSAYTPKQPSTAIDLSSMNEQFFGDDFTTLLVEGNDYNCIIFDLESIDQDTKNNLSMILFGIYATRIISPSRPDNATPHDGYFTSIVKYGIMDGGSSNPYTRLEILQSTSSSKLQMMVFPLQDAVSAKLLEDCIHEDLAYQKVQGEWMRTLHSQLRRFVHDLHGFMIGQGRLTGITRENLTSKVLDLSQKDTGLFAVDRLVRSLLPLADIPTDTLTRVYNTGQQKYMVSLTEKEWVRIWRVARVLIKEARDKNISFTGSDLIDSLQTDNRLGLHFGRRTDYMREQLNTHIPKVLGVTINELHNSADPGAFLDRIFGDAGNEVIPELLQQTLHENWHLWISMKHGIHRVQKKIRM